MIYSCKRIISTGSVYGFVLHVSCILVLRPVHWLHGLKRVHEKRKAVLSKLLYEYKNCPG